VITYLDTSALLRVILRENGAIEGLRSCEGLVSSELLVVETFRTIDRLRLQGALSLAEAASRRAVATQWLEAVDLVLLRHPIMARASDPFPTALWVHDRPHRPPRFSSPPENTGAAANGGKPLRALGI